MRALWLTLAVAVVLTSQTALCASRVIPLDSLTMVSPLTGKSIIGVGQTGSKSWMKSNTIWDGKTILLRGARGESMAFQLVFVWEPGDVIEDIKIAVDIKDVNSVRTARFWCIWNTPEIGVPLSGTKHTFNLPSKVPLESDLFTKNKYVAWSAWVEFLIPRETQGEFLLGKVSVMAKKGLPLKEFPVKIQVYPFEMPKRPNLIVEMNSYGDYTKFLGRGTAPYLKIQKLMRQHRSTFVEVPYNQSGNVHGHLTPKVNRKTGVVDWTNFDKNLSGIFDGSAFEDGQPVSHFILPLNYQWPVPFNLFKSNRKEYERINVAVRKEIIAHITKKRWTQTIFQEFHNENPANGAKIPWHLDEPRSAKDMRGHDVYATIFEKAMKNAPVDVKLHYRLDVSYWQRVRKPMEVLAPKVHDWVVSWEPKYLNDTSAQRFRKYADAGKGIFLEYGEVAGFNSGKASNNWATFIKYAKNCWLHRSDGYEQWMIDMWKCKGKPKPTMPLFYSNAAGARDLIWPGQHFGIDGPLPSLRLKAIRESTNFFDYAKLAATRDADKVDALIQRMKTDTAKPYWETKAKLAEILNSK